VKRDDICATPVGGNKVRGLEWLLGGVRPGDTIVTVGPTGSNHALATAVHAGRLGARVEVVRWSQRSNEAARAVDAMVRRAARVTDARLVPLAYAVAWLSRARGRHWIPAGGASPLAILGHVNAALELVDQVRSGACPQPTSVHVALGTGGTAAGLALGFRIAGVRIPVVAVRVVPRILGRAGRVAALANQTAALIERHTGQSLPRVAPGDFALEHRFAGEGYGAPLRQAGEVRLQARAAGIMLDDTYSLKACAAALSASDASPLLWLTFDGRVLQTANS
jgi:1-aminocyclopropane-1-carboxylate deaminase/D-cysteine desulfhydrase-like pyridoxal-dependent ACC family enzyme